VPGPNALRRLRAGTFDRRFATYAFSILAVVLVLTAGLARLPTTSADVGDPAAAQDLLALMRAGERGSWLVSYGFTRTLADGRVLTQTMQEARNPSLHVLLSGPSMTIETRTRSYDCNLVAGRWPCTGSVSSHVLPASEVMRVALAAGWYRVTRTANVTVAGERARCYRVLSSGVGQLPDIGAETDLCFAGDGIALSDRVVHATGDVDERVAASVVRRVSTARIEELAHGFDPKTAGR
jgi:hypothetical protein